MHSLGPKSAAVEVAKMTVLFAAMFGYAFALLGETTISRNVVIIYFSFIASVFVRSPLSGQSKVAITLGVSVCGMLGGWIGYLLNPPSYSLVGHVIFALAGTWLWVAILAGWFSSFDKI